MSIHTKKEGIKCPSCGNEDLTKFIFIEPAELRRSVIGFDDKEGRLQVSEDFAEDTPAGSSVGFKLECLKCDRHRTALGERVDILYTDKKAKPDDEDSELQLLGDSGVKCPHCDNDDIENFTVYEFSTWRKVYRIDGDCLVAAGHYDSEGGSNYGPEHLCCNKCNKKVGLPDGMHFDYD